MHGSRIMTKLIFLLAAGAMSWLGVASAADKKITDASIRKHAALDVSTKHMTGPSLRATQAQSAVRHDAELAQSESMAPPRPLLAEEGSRAARMKFAPQTPLRLEFVEREILASPPRQDSADSAAQATNATLRRVDESNAEMEVSKGPTLDRQIAIVSTTQKDRMAGLGITSRQTDATIRQSADATTFRPSSSFLSNSSNSIVKRHQKASAIRVSTPRGQIYRKNH
jgi:hypothetical protein